MANDLHAIRDAKTNSAANSVVRRLEWRYLAVFFTVAALVVIDQAIIQPMLIRVGAFAPAINVAGRQRMLSQRLTKASLVLATADNAAARGSRLRELRDSLAQWTSEHDALVRGKPALGVRPIRTAELDAEWQTLAPHYDAMVSAAGAIIEAHGASDTLSAERSLISQLVEHESLYLPTMDRIVKLMEDEAAKVVFRLRASALSVAGLVMLLLVGLGWFVVRPATRTIRSQVEGLEARVAHRTQELAVALESLRREVSDREGAEQRNQRLAAQLAHTERVTTMGHLTAGLAHELNQPLAAITNYTDACELLLQEVSASEPLDRVTELLIKAKRSALRAGQIVRRMRNFVRPNTATQTHVALNSLTHDIVELCRSEVTAAGAEIFLDLAAQDDVIFADSIQIQQVLVNLVQNAAQAMMMAGSDIRTISICTTNTGSGVQVDISDTGPGLATADPDAVFAPFYTTKHDGLGIGLSICRTIVENHRGKIWTALRPGHGARISFTLPIAITNDHRPRTQPNRLCC